MARELLPHDLRVSVRYIGDGRRNGRLVPGFRSFEFEAQAASRRVQRSVTRAALEDSAIRPSLLAGKLIGEMIEMLLRDDHDD